MSSIKDHVDVRGNKPKDMTLRISLLLGFYTLLLSPMANPPFCQQKEIPKSAIALCSQADISSAIEKKVQDATEYNAYRKALSITDLEEKAAALKAFVQRYPNTLLKRDALECAMLSYQQANDYRKLLTAAEHVLEVDPDNIRALAILVELARRSNDDTTSVGYAKRGLDAIPKWQKSEGMSDAAFKNLRRETERIFYSAIGFGALTAKDFVTARENYAKSLSLDGTNVMDTYQLGIADLEMKPIDPHGFWYVAKAINLAKAQGNEDAARAIRIYGTSRYQAYHGGIDGWDEIIAHSESQSSPPLDFTVAPASSSK